MTEIIPAIIAKNYQELEEKIKAVEGLCDWVQIDIMDGIFTPSQTFNEPVKLKDLKTNLKLEAHLMISSPENVIQEWINSGVKRILIHTESVKSPDNLEQIIDQINFNGLEAGIALKIETPLSISPSIINKIKVLQLMAIAEIGYYGHGFDERVLEKIKQAKEKYPDIEIEVDGGINPETAKKVIMAGAKNLVSGSYIFNGPDIKLAIEKLKNFY